MYCLTILFTGVVSVVDALSQAGFSSELLLSYFSKLPLYSQGLGWILPAAVGIVLGMLLNKYQERK